MPADYIMQIQLKIMQQ